jgi:hypothetical protein
MCSRRGNHWQASVPGGVLVVELVTVKSAFCVAIGRGEMRPRKLWGGGTAARHDLHICEFGFDDTSVLD